MAVKPKYHSMLNQMKMRIKMKKILITLSLVALFSIKAFAQEEYKYAMEMLPDKQVIYVDKLGMAGNTSLWDMLSSIPELLSRTGNDILSNFEVQIDGKGVEAEKGVILEQTRISEVEKLEISVTPSVDQQKNGQGGVINVVPKKIKEGFNGEVFAYATTEWNFLPGVDLYYKKNKMELRGTFNMEYYQPFNERYSEEISPATISQVADTLRENFCQETAKVYFKYDFTDRDVLKLWVIESWKIDKNLTAEYKTTIEDKSQSMGQQGWKYVTNSRGITDVKNNDLIATLMTEYKHTFHNGGNVTLSANYKYGWQKERRDYRDFTQTVKTPYTVDAELSFKEPLLKNNEHKLDLDFGCNANYNPTGAETYKSGNIYCSPYFTFKYHFKNWHFHAGARYQFLNRNYISYSIYTPKDDKLFSKDNHDVTANINIVWDVTENHTLRLVAMHGIIRPDDYMFYPEIVQDRRRGIWINGNPDLSNTQINSVDLNYVYHWKENDRYLILNAALGYNRADGVIEEKVVDAQSRGTHPTGFGPTIYSTYENTGINNIAKANLSLFYSKGIFSMSFAGNVFCNFMYRESGLDRYNYYNLSFTPIFNFRHQWVLSSKLMYNSAVEKENSYLGDCFYMQIRLHKTIGNWTIHGEISDVFDYTTTDVAQMGDKTCITVYDLYTRFVGLGFSYRF